MHEQQHKPEQDALFDIGRQDEVGCVWACTPRGRSDILCQNLSRAEKVSQSCLSALLAKMRAGRYKPGSR
jgi:hypothetical protein